MKRRCLECHRLTGVDTRRGLCRRCYRNHDIRDGYFTLPRGPWAKAGFTCRTAEDRIYLTDLFNKGLSDREIASVTSRSVGAVTAERQRLGLRVSKERQVAHLRKQPV